MMSIDRKAFTGFLVLLLLIPFILFFPVKRDAPEAHTELQTFCLDEGWGYRILVDGKVYIHQPTIPAISGEKPFPDEESALAVGKLVLERVQLKQDPTVTLDEINRTLTCH